MSTMDYKYRMYSVGKLSPIDVEKKASWRLSEALNGRFGPEKVDRN